MGSVSLTGKDTLVINGRVIQDLSDADTAMLEFPDDLAAVKKGKNGNAIYALNQMGELSTLTIRVNRGSEDDKFLNGLLNQQRRDFGSFILLNGEFIKRAGDGQGNINRDTYVVSGGIFTKIPGAKENVEGDTEQSVTVYEIKFSRSPRTIT